MTGCAIGCSAIGVASGCATTLDCTAIVGWAVHTGAGRSMAGRTSWFCERGGELDLGAVGRALVRKKWWVLGPALAVAALAFVGVNLITPKYKSEARIIIEGRENVFLRPEAEKGATERDRTVDQEAITSQV